MSKAEEVTEGTVPFIGKDFDLANPIQTLLLIVGLSIGFVVWHLADRMGDNGADFVAGLVANLTGYDPTSGESTDNTAPLGGS